MLPGYNVLQAERWNRKSSFCLGDAFYMERRPKFLLAKYRRNKEHTVKILVKKYLVNEDIYFISTKGKFTKCLIEEKYTQYVILTLNVT